MPPAIRVQTLGKQYRIGTRRSDRRTLRETLTAAAAGPFRRLFGGNGSPVADHSPSPPDTSLFWALKDVSFEVQPGEVVGIIGRNGAGKSTLLKILSRITEPTEGRAEINGRVGSLLEVGTGFHPELTGRENIFLNGTILGMSRAEMARKFDEMVDFAEIEPFIDTPVKRYSSGMYVRLAFAVAAYLQPEILLLDEVLAVGDIEFQKKCIGRMEKMVKEDHTVLLVSHNMGTVRTLCSKALLLDEGRLDGVGNPKEIIDRYLGAHNSDLALKALSDADHVTGVRQMRLNHVCLLNSANNYFAVYWGEPISLSLELEVLEPVMSVSFGAGIRMFDGTWIYCVHHDDKDRNSRWNLSKGRFTIRFTLENHLKPGLYRITVGAHSEHYCKNIFQVDGISLEILDHSKDGQIPFVYNPGVIDGRATWGHPEPCP